jgi:hypothetical protein
MGPSPVIAASSYASRSRATEAGEVDFAPVFNLEEEEEDEEDDEEEEERSASKSVEDRAISPPPTIPALPPPIDG